MAFAVKELRKYYGAVPVLKGVDLSVANGEIHALLGANGAGKSTLIKCISGAETPTSGEIIVDGQTFSSLTPRTSRQEGISVIYQVPSVALSLDVSENVYLGNEPTWGPIRRSRLARKLTREMMSSLGSRIEPDADLSRLGNADLQLIEIAKALVRKPKVLILDEPTAALTEREVVQLSRQMRLLRDRGLPLLFVTHRLTEALELADRVSVLRGGEIVLSERSENLTRDDLVRAIVGTSGTGANRLKPDTGQKGTDDLLSVTGLVSEGVGPIDVHLHGGEVVGVYGLTGSGRTELLESLAGAQPRHAGTVAISGEPARIASPPQALALGIALVPSDRLRKSIFSSLPANVNLLLPRLRDVSRAGLIRNRPKEDSIFSLSADMMKLQPRNPTLEARRFSGGNQQKLVIGRWLNDVGGCRILLLDEPTDGVDVGARDDLYRAIHDFVADGTKAVLIASSEPEELMRVAHRVIVLSRGRIAGEVSGAEINEHRLLELAHSSEQSELHPTT